MSRIDTLRLLVLAEMPDTLEGVELSMREITARITDLQEGHPLYDFTHARLDRLLDRRERIIREQALKV